VPPSKKPIFEIKAKQVKQILPSIPAEAGPSKLSSSLASLRQKTDARATGPVRQLQGRISRSGVEELEVDDPGNKGKGRAIERNEDDLTIKHELKLGPKEHGTDPEGENEWLFNEPNSGIRLS
jgi:hypothetical protein